MLQVLCLKQQVRLLRAKQSEADAGVRAAEAALASLQARQADAMQDVEVQLRLKQGQVECWPASVEAVPPHALLLARREVQALNAVILGKVKRAGCVWMWWCAPGRPCAFNRHQHT